MPHASFGRPFEHWPGRTRRRNRPTVSLAAVPIVAVLALGAGPGEIGALAAAQTLPFLLLSIPAGLLADRWSRTRLMVAAEALRALALMALLLATTIGQLSFALLALLGFIGAAGTVGFSVGAPALVPALVPGESLAAANGRLELARSAAFAAGPAIAGALVAWAGAPSAFVLAPVLSASATALLLRLPEPPRRSAVQRHVLDELRHGAGLVWRHPLLRPILLTAIAWNTAWFVLQAAYVPYAVRVLGLDASAVGITLACYGAGMVVGAVLASRLMHALPFGGSILFGPLLSVAASLLMAATLWRPSGVLAAGSFFIFGAGPIIWTIASRPRCARP
jgi:predicted MFS family arabinose efflux permease